VYGCWGARHTSRVGPDSTITAEVHDAHGVGDVMDDPEIVRDQQQAELTVAREAHEVERLLDEAERWLAGQEWELVRAERTVVSTDDD